MEADFGGYATKANMRCSDGVTIMKDAFKHNDKKIVPLVWQHDYNTPENILGHAVLENREDGVYAYGYFNDTPTAQTAKQLIKHKDINALSIRANELKKQGQNVLHGEIREVSLVLAGANPGAFIDNVTIQHDDGYTELDDEATIFTGLTIQHNDNTGDNVSTKTSETAGDKTVKDVYESMTDEQKQVVHFLVGEALEEGGDDDDNQDDNEAKHQDKAETPGEELKHNEKGGEMTANVFEQNGRGGGAPKATLTHSQLTAIVEDAKKMGSFKESFLKHAAEYGIEDIDILFPEAKTLQNSPELVTRRMEWVSTVLNGIRKNPFSRIKSVSADVTHDEARALGYVKGNLKKEEWFGLTSRITTPTTIYKKQKLDRDDIVDITDLDVVAWLKAEMRLMVDEEIARAVLVGDGRPVEIGGEPNPDKIKEPVNQFGEGAGIRSIANDHEFYSHKVVVPANVYGDDLVEAILRNRKYYRGSGNPTMFTTEDVLTDLLLVKDKFGRRLYANQADLESALRVSKIVPVEVMESQSVEGGELLAILVNLSDYTLGADRGGQLAMFDDFDIDYNQYKYLMETRLSGALTKFKSALVVSRASGTQVFPLAPTFDAETNTITIPSVTGVTYTIDDEPETGDVVIEEDTTVVASPDEGYYFPGNVPTQWTFEYVE